MENQYQHETIFKSTYRNIQYYKEMIELSRNQHQRMYYEYLLYNERIRLNYLENYYYNLNQRIQSNQLAATNKKIITIEELAQYDGSNEKPAYVAVNGIVYDVSLEATWGGGTHFSLYAGKDLTTQFIGCHGENLDVLSNLPQVGILKRR